MSAGRFTARSPFLRGRSSGLESDLINRLRRLPVGPVPDARFKSDLRSQLVSITARIVAESAPTLHEGTRRKTAVDAPSRVQAGGRRRRGLFAHPGLSLAGLAATLVLLIVTANSMARNALPGDALYGLKRTSENLAVSMASGDVAKGKEYLAQARSRADEASALVARGSNVSRIQSTLDEGNEASRSGMQSLARAAVTNVTATPLDTFDSWARQQQAALASLGNQPGATAAVALLKRMQARSAALRANIGCPCLSAANSDDLGPVPCSPCTPTGKIGQPGVPLPNNSVGSSAASATRSHSVGASITSVPGATSGANAATSIRTNAAPQPTTSGGGVINVPPISLPGVPPLGGLLSGHPSPAPDASSSGAFSSLGVLGLLGLN